MCTGKPPFFYLVLSVAPAVEFDEAEGICTLDEFCLSRQKLGVLMMIFSSNCTGKSLSEALIHGSTNPQYNKRLFIDLPVQYLKTTRSEHGENKLCA